LFLLRFGGARIGKGDERAYSLQRVILMRQEDVYAAPHQHPPHPTPYFHAGFVGFIDCACGGAVESRHAFAIEHDPRGG
jgi:hypothetical protein